MVLYLYIFCAIGEKVKTHFENLVDLTYECNWYRLSMKQQKCFLIMILIQQEPVCLHGLTNAQYSLEMYKRVK